MRYFCLICDYDGTIARDSYVTPTTIEALKRVRASGRKVVLATGRELRDLEQVFPELTIFDRVVAENGGLLYRPAQREKVPLTKGPSPEFVALLKARGVAPMSAGETIVSTWRPNEVTVLDAIQELGLDLQITFNKNAVMVLPAGVNKGSGVKAALEELDLSIHNAVGVGDAENDHGFLEICECRVAVQNAVPALKERADLVMNEARGEGVERLIDALLENDLADVGARMKRHQLVLGKNDRGEEFAVNPYGTRLAVAGPSGSGKSTFISALIEQLTEKQYQVCVIDPEGDYGELKSFVELGGTGHKPEVPEILDVLDSHARSLTVNLLGVPLADRPGFFQKTLSGLQELRARTGRPHWIIVDEVHHLLPASLDSADLVIPLELSSAAVVTVQLDHVARSMLDAINGLAAVGAEPGRVVKEFNRGASAKLDANLPELAPLETGTVAVWLFGEGRKPERVTLEPTKGERRRHRQKYAAGDLGEDKSFYFRGPEQKLKLRAQNMMLFAQIAEGVDDATWEFHLRSHDYSQWVREMVKDEPVADELSAIEDDDSLSATESRAKILEVIRKTYTAPV
jgi:HAD superfamily hydrolase (TIGR01484 family)